MYRCESVSVLLAENPISFKTHKNPTLSSHLINILSSYKIDLKIELFLLNFQSAYKQVAALFNFELMKELQEKLQSALLLFVFH